MLVKSLVNGEEWLWVNIPKTATTSTMKTFFPDKKYNEQSHNTYKDLVSMYGKHDAFTVVRNPINRFMSGLNHLFSVCECKQCKINVSESPTTENVIGFLADVLKLKNQTSNFFYKVYLNNTNKLYVDVVDSIQKNFYRNIQIGNTQCVRWTLILPQSHQLHEATDIKIFKYENIQEFFLFVKTELGYTITETRYRNYTNTLTSVDISNTTLQTLLYELHKDDFINFNYSI